MMMTTTVRIDDEVGVKENVGDNLVTSTLQQQFHDRLKFLVTPNSLW